jgi:cellulose synthase/poly-beta-1,6-N-acetylglucosamine synthase-like glycosyltransferase
MTESARYANSVEKGEQADPPSKAQVGVVLIGRNEAQRLRRVVAAACEQADYVVYVDSNSTDDSRELAASQGASVVHLTTGPYTPSRGRQVGFEAVLGQCPDLPYVHFVDGDCVLAPGWIERSFHYLEAHRRAGAVFGRRREERCAESFYSRMMDIDWDHPAGEATNFGGDVLLRTEAVQRAGGWSAKTINAEDIDLSFRVRAQGWTIVRLADEMTQHDVRMSRFGEYWRRSVRAGYGFAEVGWRYRQGPGKLLLRRMASAVLYGFLLPLAALVLVFFWWPGAALIGLLYVRVFWVIALWARRRGATWRTSLDYAALNLACKSAAFVGVARYMHDRAVGRAEPSDHLIVYRHPSVAGHQGGKAGPRE